MQILIFVLTLLYFVISAMRKKNKAEQDFEWEGDGVLDDIIQKSKTPKKQQEQEDEWQPWMLEDQPEPVFYEEETKEKSYQEELSAIATKNDLPNEQVDKSYEEFSPIFEDSEVKPTSSPKFSSPPQKLDIDKESTFPTMKKKVDGFHKQTVSQKNILTQSFFSRYTTEQLLVLIPAIMERKEKDF